MSCDVGKATEGLENELWRRWAELILQSFRHFTYVKTHSPTLSLLYLRHSSFSNPSFASPTSQALHLIHMASRPQKLVTYIFTSYLDQERVQDFRCIRYYKDQSKQLQDDRGVNREWLSCGKSLVVLHFPSSVYYCLMYNITTQRYNKHTCTCPVLMTHNQIGQSTPVVPWLSYSQLEPRFAGSNPARVAGFFQSVKILSMTSFGGEVKPWVPCRRCTACKWTSSRNLEPLSKICRAFHAHCRKRR